MKRYVQVSWSRLLPRAAVALPFAAFAASLPAASDQGAMKAELSMGTGSSLIGYRAPGTGAVDRTLNGKVSDFVSTRDYGVVGDGLADDTAAFNRARDAARLAGVPLRIFGTLLISSPIAITAKEHWIFEGSVGNSSGSLPSSYLKKASSLKGDFVTITASNTMIEYGGLIGQPGNAGDGYVIQANGVTLNHPYVQRMGRDGIRVGKDSGVNANLFTLIRPTSSMNGRYGFNINDNPGGAVNANAGQLINPLAQSNGSHGIYVNAGYWDVIIGPVSEVNTGYGIYLDALSSTSIYGGDSEANAGGNLYQANPEQNKILRLSVNGVDYDSNLNVDHVAPALHGRNVIQNGNFSALIGWGLLGGASISRGTLSTPARSSGFQVFHTVVGAQYSVEVTITGAATRNIVRVGSNGPSSHDLLNDGYITTALTKRYTFTAVSAQTWLTLLNDANSSATSTWDDVRIYQNVASAGSIGYTTGAGGAVTQTRSKSTGVALDALSGQITMNNAALAAGAAVSFTLSNARIAAHDVVMPSIASGATAGAYSLTVDAVRDGACRFSLRNASANSLSEAPAINFIVIKGATN